MAKPNVLILCTGNTARSQMAEAFLKKYAGESLEVFSAGYHPREINPLTLKVMAEKGLDLSGHQSKGVRDFLGKMEFRYLIIVCEVAEQTCPKNFPGVRFRVFWPFDDPAAATGSEEEKLAKFRQVRDQIDRRIQDWLHDLPRFDSHWQTCELKITTP
ncbi:arsenate reductase ArsC [Desulfobacca acetoxidans]